MKRALVAVPALLLVALSACSGSDKIATRTANAGTKTGGTITVAIEEPRSIDPPAADPQDSGGSAVVNAMCDRLVELDPVTGEPKPGIAESWIASDGGQRITFKLRKGVRFHDGKELLAEDVVYSLSRIADRDFAGPEASIMEPVFGYDQVHGNEEVSDETLRKQLRGLTVIENYSFQVLLTEKRSDFFRALSNVAASIVPKQAVEKDPIAFAREPICAGPYHMTSPWSPGKTEIKLARFDDYYGKNAAFTNGGTGYADHLDFKIYPNRAAQSVAFDKGEVDVASVTEGSPLVAQRKASLVAGRTGALEYIGLPTTTAPFDKRGVRIAFSQALDRRAIVNEVYGGLRESATGLLPPGLGSLHRKTGCGGHAPPTADPQAARRSLKSAGVDLTGKTLKLYFNDEFGHRKLVEAAAKQWTAVFGVSFTLVGMGWGPYADKAVGQPGFDAPFRMTWLPDYASPDRYLQPLFDSHSVGRNNYMHYVSRDFDRGLDKQARRAIDPRDNRREYQNLETLVCGDMPLVPVDYGTRLYEVNKTKVGGANDSLTSMVDGTLVLREVYAR